MYTELLLKGRLQHFVSAIERNALEAAVLDTIELAPRTNFVERGERLKISYYVLQGEVGRYIDSETGNRHLIGINIAGDFIDLHGFAMKRHDHSISSIGHVKLARIPHDRIAHMVDQYPSLGDVLWVSALLDAAMHREWIFRLGCLKSERRIAHFISECIERVRLVGLYDGRKFPFRLIQDDFAQACGMSPVHANRCFQSLYNRGFLCLPKAGKLEILDEEGLRRLGEFDGSYLYAGSPLGIDNLEDRMD